MDYTQVTTDVQIKATAELAREIWTEHYTAIIGAAQVKYMLAHFQSANAIADQIENQGYIYYLIQADKQTFGYFAVIPQEDELFLSKLYIQKAKRGKGFARRTIEFLKIIAIERNLGSITLTVNKNNTEPIAAYEKLGFVNTGPIVQDIGGGFIMDDYKMELKLL